jgi:uncharacterized PurR-regulated membrane protein YhhQ (DUF165 family)
MQIPAVAGDGLVSDNQFNGVFGQSLWIIVGSITAFMFSTNRCHYFSFSKKQNGNKMIWLRSTGSTASHKFDSFILGIALDDG